MSIRKRYRRFHGHSPRYEMEADIHYPKRLAILGRIHAVEYETDKLNGGGDGTMAIYRHVFESEAFLCEDEKSNQLYIIGEDIIVTDAGIEN